MSAHLPLMFRRSVLASMLIAGSLASPYAMADTFGSSQPELKLATSLADPKAIDFTDPVEYSGEITVLQGKGDCENLKIPFKDPVKLVVQKNPETGNLEGYYVADSTSSGIVAGRSIENLIVVPTIPGNDGSTMQFELIAKEDKLVGSFIEKSISNEPVKGSCFFDLGLAELKVDHTYPNPMQDAKVEVDAFRLLIDKVYATEFDDKFSEACQTLNNNLDSSIAYTSQTIGAIKYCASKAADVDLDQAFSYQEKTVQLFKAQSKEWDQTLYSQQILLGFYASKLGWFEAGLDYILDADKNLPQSKVTGNVIVKDKWLMEIYYNLENMDKSIETANKLLTELEQYSEDPKIVTDIRKETQVNLIASYMYKADYKKATEILTAMEKDEERGTILHAEILRQLGVLYSTQNDKVKAQQYLEDAFLEASSGRPSMQEVYRNKNAFNALVSLVAFYEKENLLSPEARASLDNKTLTLEQLPIGDRLTGFDTDKFYKALVNEFDQVLNRAQD